MGRSPLRWTVVALATASIGCFGSAQRGQDRAREHVGTAAGEVVRDKASGEKLTYADLDEMTRAYADRYATFINMAMDAVERDNPAIVQRRDANRRRVVSISSIYDIATNPDPFTRLLDMLIVVTLQSQVLIDDALADKDFGDRAEQVVVAVRQAREDIWGLAARALTQEQLHTLDLLIWEWHREHPDMREVAFVRFDDFGASRGKSLVAAAASGSGLLVNLSESMHSVDEMRMLAERAFYLAKRFPVTVSWTAKSVLYEVLAQPEVQQLLSDYHDMSQAALSASDTFRDLPDRVTAERESLERIIHSETGEIGKLLKEYRAAVAETSTLLGSAGELFKSGERIVVELRETSRALTETAGTVDRTLARYDAPKGEKREKGENGEATAPVDASKAGPPPAPAKPFDIADYVAAAQEMTRAVTEMNRLVQSTAGLIEAQEWTTRIDEIDALGAKQLERAQEKGRFVIDRAYVKTLWVVGAVVAGMLLHAVVWHLLRRRSNAPTGREGSAPRAS